MRIAAVALALVLALAGCTARSPAPVDQALNPKVAPAPGGITVAPELAAVTPPPGMISQEEAKQIALASRWDMPLVLSRMRFDEANGLWEVIFTTDGRFAMQPRSHMAPPDTSSDPAEQRKAETSWFSIPTELNLAIDGRTGERWGGGFTAAAPDLTRKDLEHYRGRIIYGGEVVALRLTNPDGTWEGRTLMVDVPQAALTAAGPAFWQLKYGMGRLLDVWGLTGPQGRVVAYRLALADPPDERLLANRLVVNVPAMPGAIDLPEGMA
ncbi:MAG TPA: hypothetical protein VNT75_19135, partial [Symbiobacteriaceae bacterium]|nr:hypothetical protein [Symbiobacteriaceae bacterium]